ncbi:MAG: phytanoyl-CoA dioxygenase [Phycisphaeraceae bacterium]|nr:phytanoyl-CoA dioxygenase [Phycisphaeraceae bacterium]
MTTIPDNLSMQGEPVDTSPGAFGLLEDSAALLDDPPALQRRMEEDGYLFLRGYLDREEVMAARLEVCRRLAAMGYIDTDQPLIEAMARPDTPVPYKPQTLTTDNGALLKLLYDGRMIAFYERFLGGAVSHYDYTWFRAMSPFQRATLAHCDVVYMGRGTRNLFTSWTPIGDAPLEEGPLCVMPRSHRIEKLRDNYCRTDVDKLCRNRPLDDGRLRPQSPGSLSFRPVPLRRNLGLPFLSTNFEAGDLLVFSIFTIHCGLDNHGRRVRLSTDTRYQLASEPQDERWISIDGRPPTLHGDASKLEMIC